MTFLKYTKTLNNIRHREIIMPISVALIQKNFTRVPACMHQAAYIHILLQKFNMRMKSQKSHLIK